MRILKVFLLLICIVSLFHCRKVSDFDSDKSITQYDHSNINQELDSLIEILSILDSEELEGALKLSDKVISEAKIARDQKSLANAFLAKGAFYWKLNEIDSSINYSDLAMNSFLILGDKSGVADCYKLQAILYRVQDKNETALDKNRKSLAIYQNLNDTIGILRSWNGMALSFNALGKYDSAVVYYIRIMELGEKTNNQRSIINAKLNLGNTYVILKDYDKAKNLANEIISQIEKLENNEERLALAYIILGNSKEKLKDYEGAIQAYEKANEIYKSIDNKSGIAISLTNIGGVYYNTEQFDSVIPYYDSSLIVYKELNDKQGIMIIYGNKAVYYEKLHDYKKALAYFDSSMVLASELDDPDQKLVTLENIYYFYKDRSVNYKKALTYFSKYVDLKDSLFNIQKMRTINDHEVKYETEKKEAKILNLTNENLLKDLAIRKEKNQKNMFAAGVGLFLLLIIFTLLYFKSLIKRNRLIAEQKLQKAEEERKLDSARSLLEGQEKERLRVSRELHDSIGMLLSTSNLHLTKAIQGVSSESLNEAKSLVIKANEDVRRISRGLFPPVLQMNGLNGGIEELLSEVDKIPDKFGSFFVKGSVFRLSETREIMVYRIMQEMINNFLKHSDGDSVDVELDYQNNNLFINYTENGSGFDFETNINQKSVGLKSIQSRLTFLNATVELDRKIKEMNIKITVPRTEPSAAN